MKGGGAGGLGVRDRGLTHSSIAFAVLPLTTDPLGDGWGCRVSRGLHETVQDISPREIENLLIMGSVTTCMVLDNSFEQVLVLVRVEYRFLGQRNNLVDYRVDTPEEFE